MTEKFEVTEDHLKLLRHAYVNWNPMETGAPSIDPKRPYGNSNFGVVKDISRILLGKELTSDEPEHEQDELLRIHGETQTALQICLSTGKFEPGWYEKENEFDSRSWKSI